VELLHICVRRTLPWHDEAAVAAALVPNMRPKVELWNATFNLRYPAFRLRLTRIARENLSRIENAKLARLEETPPGALVVPVDDDDWLSPEIGSRLLAEPDPSPHGYHWNRYILEAPRHPRRWPWARERRAADTSRYTCGSNNYAIRNLPELAAAISSHVKASEHFDGNPSRVKHLDASLSLQSRNLASQTTLGKRVSELTRDELIEKFRGYRALYDRVRLPRELAWAQPSVIAMAELMHELRLK
jgi:hypothetical protein